jgi:hypothetical protein
MTWERMLERMKWRSPFGDLPDAWKGGRMRRSCWPTRNRPLQALHPRIDELPPLLELPAEMRWHIWHRDDVGDQSTYEGGLCKGWGGQMGWENAEVVLVNGDELRDGTMYTPTEGDKLAQDWEIA